MALAYERVAIVLEITRRGFEELASRLAEGVRVLALEFDFARLVVKVLDFELVNGRTGERAGWRSPRANKRETSRCDQRAQVTAPLVLPSSRYRDDPSVDGNISRHPNRGKPLRTVFPADRRFTATPVSGPFGQQARSTHTRRSRGRGT
ncbi:MAG: hypothetical protein C0511_03690 [Hyphomicrobium sp.]|nr:hypothetical protein [Hyphomicrobium sp.]